MTLPSRTVQPSATATLVTSGSPEGSAAGPAETAADPFFSPDHSDALDDLPSMGDRYRDLVDAVSGPQFRGAVLSATEASFGLRDDKGPLQFISDSGSAYASDSAVSDPPTAEVTDFLQAWLQSMSALQAKLAAASVTPFVDAYVNDADPGIAAELSAVRAELTSKHGSAGAPSSVTSPESPTFSPGAVPRELMGVVRAARTVAQAKNPQEVQTADASLDTAAVSYLHEVDARMNRRGSKLSSRLQPWQIMGLKAWLNAHFAHPYPSPDEKKQLCSELSITMTQLSNWFVNTRHRLWQPLTSGAVPATMAEEHKVSLLQCSLSAKAKKAIENGPVPEGEPPAPAVAYPDVVLRALEVTSTVSPAAQATAAPPVTTRKSSKRAKVDSSLSAAAAQGHDQGEEAV